MAEIKEYEYICFGEKYKVHIRQGWYAGDRLALELISDFGEPVSKITVNVPEEPLGEGEILVKTWGENERMIEFVLNNGIARDTGRRVHLGAFDAVAWVMKLTEGVLDGAAD